jgi:hypothetical protein
MKNKCKHNFQQLFGKKNKPVFKHYEHYPYNRALLFCTKCGESKEVEA